MQAWSTQLTAARRSVGLTQEEVGGLAGISSSSIKSYELGRRRPTSAHLRQIFDALNADWRIRSEIMVALGLVPELPALGGRASVERYMTLDEATEAIAHRAWPALVLNERVELLAMNRAGFRILPIEPERLHDPVERNLLVVALDPKHAWRLVNWDEGVSLMIATFKAHIHGPESLEDPSSYFSAVLGRVYAGDPRLVRRFIELWDAIPGSYPSKVSWNYQMVWRTPESEVLRFRCFVNSVNELHCLDIDDWFPGDAESFARLERLLVSPPPLPLQSP